MNPTTVNPRSLGVEAKFFDVDLGQLKDALIAAGHPDQVASGVVGWIVDKRRGIDRATAPTKARYRKLLKELAERSTDPDPDEVPIIVVPRVTSTRRRWGRRRGRGPVAQVFGGLRATA